MAKQPNRNIQSRKMPVPPSQQQRNQHVEDGGDDTLLDLGAAQGRVLQLFNRFRVPILGALGGILAIVIAVFVYQNFISAPREKAASEAIAKAESYFAVDSFALALNGVPGSALGFAEIIDKYGSTKAGNMARYYAAVCFLNLGSFDAAINLLERFKAKGTSLPVMKQGLLGDAYSEKGEFEKALSYYKKAANTNRNEFLTPYYLFKAAMLLEKMNKKEEAIKYYAEIRQEYFNSQQSIEAEKHIVRLGGKPE